MGEIRVGVEDDFRFGVHLWIDNLRQLVVYRLIDGDPELSPW